MLRIVPFIIILFLFTIILVKVTPAAAEAEFTLSQAVFHANNPNLAMQDFSSGKVSPTNITSCNTPVNQFSDDCFNPGDILPRLAITTDPDFGDTILVGPFRGDNNNLVKSLSPDGAVQNSVIEFSGNNVLAARITIGCLFDIGVMAPLHK